MAAGGGVPAVFARTASARDAWARKLASQPCAPTRPGTRARGFSGSLFGLPRVREALRARARRDWDRWVAPKLLDSEALAIVRQSLSPLELHRNAVLLSIFLSGIATPLETGLLSTTRLVPVATCDFISVSAAGLSSTTGERSSFCVEKAVVGGASRSHCRALCPLWRGLADELEWPESESESEEEAESEDELEEDPDPDCAATSDCCCLVAFCCGCLMPPGVGKPITSWPP